MAELKTKATQVSVTDFLNAVEPESKRDDAFTLLKLMEKITGQKAVMWGPTIVGFGKYHYKYESGHEGDMCITGFSPRKANLVVYLNTGSAKEQGLLDNLGKHKATGACVYINKLSDIDLTVLEKSIKLSIDEINKKYPSS